jgi:hypothetical protein
MVVHAQVASPFPNITALAKLILRHLNLHGRDLTLGLDTDISRRSLQLPLM